MKSKKGDTGGQRNNLQTGQGKDRRKERQRQA